MPIYDYTCARCGHLAEVIHAMRDAGPRFCPNCGAEGTMRKGFAAPAVHFKGSGWAKKDRSAAATSSGASSGRSKTAKSGDDSGPGAGTGAGSSGTPSAGEASTQAGSGQAAATSTATDGGG